MDNSDPNYQSPDFTQGQEQSAKQRYDFWNNYYKQYVGQPAAQYTSQSSAPAFNQAAQNTADFAKAQGGPNSGSVDFEALQRNLGNQSTLNSKTEDLQSYLSNMGKNQQAQEGSQIGGLQGNIGLGQNQQGIENMGIGRFAQMLKLQDYIKSMNRAYQNSKGDPMQQILGSLGGAVGDIAGGAV